MAIWKRPELLILLLITAGIIGYIVVGQNKKSADPSTESPSDKANESLNLNQIEITRDYGNARLDISFSVINTTSDTLTFLAPDTLLLRPDSSPVDPFILAFAQPDPLDSGKSSKRTLSYWLESSDLENALTLQIGEDTLEIKSPNPYPLDSLENQETATFSSADWTSNPTP